MKEGRLILVEKNVIDAIRFRPSRPRACIISCSSYPPSTSYIFIVPNIVLLNLLEVWGLRYVIQFHCALTTDRSSISSCHASKESLTIHPTGRIFKCPRKNIWGHALSRFKLLPLDIFHFKPLLHSNSVVAVAIRILKQVFLMLRFRLGKLSQWTNLRFHSFS